MSATAGGRYLQDSVTTESVTGLIAAGLARSGMKAIRRRFFHFESVLFRSIWVVYPKSDYGKIAFPGHPRLRIINESLVFLQEASGGVEPPYNGFAIRGETPENIGTNDSALHLAQHSFQKWAVFVVDADGQIQSKIVQGENFTAAVAFAAGWQSNRQQMAL